MESQLTNKKWEQDKAFFGFLWQMMRGDEGYFIAGYFWILAATVPAALGVLVVAGVQAVIE
jgi:hypothetical protein